MGKRPSGTPGGKGKRRSSPWNINLKSKIDTKVGKVKKKTRLEGQHVPKQNVNEHMIKYVIWKPWEIREKKITAQRVIVEQSLREKIHTPDKASLYWTLATTLSYTIRVMKWTMFHETPWDLWYIKFFSPDWHNYWWLSWMFSNMYYSMENCKKKKKKGAFPCFYFIFILDVLMKLMTFTYSLFYVFHDLQKIPMDSWFFTSLLLSVLRFRAL